MIKLNSSDQRDERILILAPIGRDGAMTGRFLSEAGLYPVVCHETESLHQEIKSGVGLIFLTGEALTPETLRFLVEILAQQETWSDIPLIVVTSGGAEIPANATALATLSVAGNVTLIERPVRTATLLSAIRSALRARRRQYDVRDHLAEESRAQEALRQSEERLRIALDAAQLGAWQLDLASGVLDCSPTCKANFGLPPDAPISYSKLLAAIHSDDRDAVSVSFEHALRERNDYRSEYRVLWPDGTLHWILATGRANYETSGEPFSMVGVTLDITERKIAEKSREQLLKREQQARAEAEAASLLKDEFLTTVSHELRTPLTAILGWINLLRMGRLDESTTTSALETIERNTRSQVQLINDLLDVSRILSGKMRLDVHKIKIAEVMQAAIDTVRPSAATKNIQIEVAIASPSDLVLGDAERLQQVVWNLLANAVKFTPEGGHIRVQLERSGSHFEITVSDSGKGIAPEFLPHIFDRFRQADQSSTRSYGGLGLGLSIVRQIVELHGGTVRAVSDGDGKGATFVVQLPVATNFQKAAPLTTPVAATGQEELTNSSRFIHLRMLVVDDEVDTRDLLRAVLEGCGAQIRTAASVAEALRVFREWQPDVLVSDIGMPDEDGYTLIRKIREFQIEEGGRVPAIALTAYVRADDRERALRAGFQRHIPKPIEAIELISVLTSLTERSQG